MRLNWTLEDDKRHRYIAVTPRYTFVMVAPKRGHVGLLVQHATADLASKPVDQRTCRTRRVAERMAQRFEDSRDPRRLR
jgi:hypothetical protein